MRTSMPMRTVQIVLAVLAVSIAVAEGANFRTYDHSAGAVVQAASADQEQAAGTKRLRQELAAATREREKLHLRLDEVASTARRDIRQLRQGLVLARRSARRELDEERHTVQAARADATKAEAATRKEHGQRLGLLEQISELSNELMSARDKAAVIGQAETGRLQAETGRLRGAEARVFAKEREASEKERALQALRKVANEARANASLAETQAEAAQRQASILRGTLAKEQLRLRAGLLQEGRSSAAVEAKSKENAALMQRVNAAEEALQGSRKELDASRRGRQDLEDLLAASHAESEHLRDGRSALEKQYASLNASNAALSARARSELRDTMVSAARRVHELEDDNEDVKSKLASRDGSLKHADTEVDGLRKELESETFARDESSREVAELQRAANSANATASNALKRVAELAAEITALHEEKSRLVGALNQQTRKAALWHEEAQERDDAAKAVQGKADNLSHENAALGEQVSSMSPRAQRADDLADELDSLRGKAAHNASLLEKLEEQVTRLRDLKEQYSQDYEVAKNESASKQAEGARLREQLLLAQAETKRLKNQRDDAAQHMKDSRSQEDEYFDENTRQQQQIEALTAKLTEVSAAENRSQEAVEGLRARVQDLREDADRDKENSHAAWISNQKELMRMQSMAHLSAEEKTTLEAELARSRAVLDDSQRKILGLPAASKAVDVAQQAAKGKNAPPAPNASAASEAHVVAPAAPSTLQRLADVFATPPEKHF